MKKSIVWLAIAAVLVMTFSFAKTAAAQSEAVRRLYVSAANVPTNMSGVYTYPAPPKDFNFLTATDAELATYGFPQRPDKRVDEEHYKMWQRVMTAAKIRWNGELKSLPHTSRGMIPARQPAAKPSAVKPASATKVTSLNWSGVALTNKVKKFSAASFTDIYSLFTVPLTQSPFGLTGCNSDYQVLNFVGLDGYVAGRANQPGDALEGGYYSDIECPDFTPTPGYWAVFGLFGGGLEEPDSLAFTINPGDVMYVEVNDGSGENPAYFFLEDLTTLTFSSYSVSWGPGGQGFIGKSAEWIVSRTCVYDDESGEPTYDCIQLPNLIAVFFDGGAAQTANGHVYYPGSTAASTAVITMRDDNDTQDIEVVSQGSGGYEGKHSLWLQTTGCAWSGGCVP